MTNPPGTFIEIDREGRECEDHGPYMSVRFERENSKAPEAIRTYWTNCPPCNDIFEREAVEAEAAAHHNGEHLRNMALEQAGVPKRFIECSLKNWQHAMPKQRRFWEWCRDFAVQFYRTKENGVSVVLAGSPGTGKTHLAIAMLREALRDHHSCAYTTVLDMLGRIKNTYNAKAHETEHDAIQAFSAPALLVIDEVGKQLDTNYENTQLFRILDTRYREKLPTILVSNLEQNQLVEFLGDAVIDRLSENGGKILVFDWASYRKKTKPREQKA